MQSPSPASRAAVPASPAPSIASTTSNASSIARPNVSLYVGDLHPDTNESLLFTIFNNVAPVASIRICRDQVTRRSLGYAYVNYHSSDEAARAIEELNDLPINGRPCRIMWSQRNPALRQTGVGNIFVKNLGPEVDNKALRDTFSQFGNILSCKIAFTPTGESKGYGFVHYETKAEADEAIAKVNGMLIADRKVYVGLFERRDSRRKKVEWKNCYVKNIPIAWSKEKLDEVFSSVGPIASSVIMTNDEGVSRGFGFVNYENHDSAKAAVEKLNGLVVDDAGAAPEGDADETKEGQAQEAAEAAAPAEGEGEAAAAGAEEDSTPEPRKLYVARAQKKRERQEELRKYYMKKKTERLRKFQDLNLYVKNLDPSLDDAWLREEFGKLGTITSTRIMKDRSGHSKGFGFVCFSTPEEATRAVAEMNQRMYMGKPIYVALAQRKELRRAQIEAQYKFNRFGAAAPRGMPMPYGGMMPMPGYYPGMQQMPMAAAAANYGMVPAVPTGPGANNAGRGGRSGRGRRSARGGAAGRGAAPSHPGVPAPAPVRSTDLTEEILNSMPPAAQKNALGERLFPLVMTHQPRSDLAAKITGMLLEMATPEVLQLLVDEAALKARIDEAITVLREHQMAQAGPQ